MKRALLSLIVIIPLLLLVLAFHAIPDNKAPANDMEKALTFFVNGETRIADPHSDRQRFPGWGPYRTAVLGIRRCWVIWGDTEGVYLRFDYDVTRGDWVLMMPGTWHKKEDPDALRDLILLYLEATMPRQWVPEGLI
jgi:hypothetical protein